MKRSSLAGHQSRYKVSHLWLTLGHESPSAPAQLAQILSGAIASRRQEVKEGGCLRQKQPPLFLRHGGGFGASYGRFYIVGLGGVMGREYVLSTKTSVR